MSNQRFNPVARLKKRRAENKHDQKKSEKKQYIQ